MNRNVLSGTDEGLNSYEWLQIESMRLMEEYAEPEHGICGNEWRIIEELRDAEETGHSAEVLQALRDCACSHMAEMARSMVLNS